MRQLAKNIFKSALLSGALLAPMAAQATLDPFQAFVGKYGLSTDGAGSLASSYSINAFVPVGATVTSAFLYQSNVYGAGLQSVSLNGNALSFTSLVSPNFTSGRADVTSIVASAVNGGLGGSYSFTVGESNSGATDGTALVVVYELASLQDATVAILDGFARFEGDETSFNFAQPLDPTAAGFVADLRLGIGFSCCSQASTIEINGTTITTAAGNNDDGTQNNGALITVGGDDDPFSVLNPTYASDRERYDISPFINVGDTSVVLRSTNASRDDNFFLAALRISGIAGVNEPPPVVGAIPEPSTWGLMLMGFGAVGYSLRRRRGYKVSHAL